MESLVAALDEVIAGMTKIESRYGSADPTLPARGLLPLRAQPRLGGGQDPVPGRDPRPGEHPRQGRVHPGPRRPPVEHGDLRRLASSPVAACATWARTHSGRTPASDWFFSSLGGFPINRDSADREALTQCLELTAEGEAVVMFPEGTRRFGPTIEPEHMRDGVAYVASRGQVPIVPVGIGGSERAMPSGGQVHPALEDGPGRGRATDARPRSRRAAGCPAARSAR